jgi:hypothetical protein
MERRPRHLKATWKIASIEQPENPELEIRNLNPMDAQKPSDHQRDQRKFVDFVRGLLKACEASNCVHARLKFSVELRTLLGSYEHVISWRPFESFADQFDDV